MDSAYVFGGTEKEGGHKDPVVDGLRLLLREEGDVEVSRSVDREPWFGRQDGGYWKFRVLIALSVDHTFRSQDEMIMNREMERTFFALPMPLAEQEQRSDEDAHVQQRYVDGKRHRVQIQSCSGQVDEFVR